MTRTRKMALLAAAWLLLAWSGPGAHALTDARKTFSLVPPPGWKVERAPDASADLRFLAPKDPGFQANLSVRQVSYPEGTLSPEAKASFRDELFRDMPQFKPVAEADETLAGLPAWRLHYTGRVGRTPVEGFTLVGLKKTRMYIVTFVAAQPRYAAYDRTVEAALKTFKAL